MYAFIKMRTTLKSEAYTGPRPPATVTEMIEIIKVALIAQTLVLAEDVHAEIHRLGIGLVPPSQAFTVEPVAIQPPRRNLGLRTRFGAIAVMEAAKLVVAERTDLGVRHIEGRRRTGGQAEDGSKKDQGIAHG